jgi:hypothetical protein
LKFSALGKQSHLRFSEQLDFANQSVTAAELACAARSVAISIAAHAEIRPQRRFHFTSFFCFAFISGSG